MQVTRYLKRIIELGPRGTWNRITHRTKRTLFALRWKRKALALQANHQWEAIVKKHKLDPNFDLFFDFHTNPHAYFLPIKQRAVFDKTPWPTKQNIQFYQKIHSCDSHHTSFDTYAPDIKEPWEQARFQHKFDHRDIEAWIDQNPFLLGVNWVCPMEVAIRAINWILWFQIVKNSQQISIQFWKKFFCSLYDHAYYLENNWETSDRPNNHYIADLVGYFYLCCFFEHITHFEKTKKITYKKILSQLNHQVHPDGTSYEGSTAYHMLVTELFWLFSLACDNTLPQSFHEKLDRMIAFIEHCTINQHEFVQIGDNDSGVVTHSFTRHRACGTHGLVHYPHFGISIIKKDGWHITFRHPTYQPHQPTGHFHRDELAITFAYHEIPILVDPGSYVYTSNKAWRNRMRSYPSHNTFYPATQRDVDLEVDLFQLPKQAQLDTATIGHKKNSLSIQNSFRHQTRKITLEKETFSIEDTLNVPTTTIWTLVFHPKIRIVPVTQQCWEIFYQNKKLFILTSSLKFSATSGFYSPRYGVIQPTITLIAQEVIDPPRINKTQRLKSATAFFNNSCFHLLKFVPASKSKMP